MAEHPKVGDKVAGGVVVRAIATAEGLELVIRVPVEYSERPISAPLTQEQVDKDRAPVADEVSVVEKHGADGAKVTEKVSK